MKKFAVTKIPPVNSNKEKLSYNILPRESNQSQANTGQGKDHNFDYSHRGKNSHSKNTAEEEKGVDNEKLLSNLKAQIKEDELEEQEEKEQQILIKDNKQNIIDFIIDNKESIRIEDLKIYGPIYKCYREKGNCKICLILLMISP